MTKKQPINSRISRIPLIVWILLGFSLPYFFFFIYPIFFSQSQMVFPQYIPVGETTGIDLKDRIDFSKEFIINKESTYIAANDYPPLKNILSIPLNFLSLKLAYKMNVALSILCFVIITFVLPLFSDKNYMITPIFILLFISGLFSYGFQFELERGQFDLITIALCFLGIWLFHKKPELKFFAYILFTLSIQLKVYPAIFIFMFISDWHDWKNNLRRIALLGLSNFALLFVLGLEGFLNFSKSLSSMINVQIWVGNHSTQSFISYLSNIASHHNLNWINQNSKLIEATFLAMIGFSLVLIIVKSYRENIKGINPTLLLACTISALLIPAISHDYTLSFLPGPVSFFLLDKERSWSNQTSYPRIYQIVLLFLLSCAYASTLFSYTNKLGHIGIIFQNNFPALFGILIIITIFFLFSKPVYSEKKEEFL